MLSHEDTKQYLKILLSTEADVDQAWATPLCCSDQGLDPWFWFQVRDPCSFTVSSLQSLSRVQLFVTPWTIARQAPLFSISQSLFKFISIESVMLSNHLVLCHPLLLPPSIFPSIRVFSNESVLHIRWPKYWSFSISPSNEYSGLISFRIDCFDLLALVGEKYSKMLI